MKNNNRTITVITTHLDADIDSIAGTFAAGKLYKSAIISFPDSSDISGKFSDYYFFKKINHLPPEKVELSDVATLILVGTRHKMRLGVYAELIDNPDVEIIVYDHHPKLKSEIVPNSDFYKSAGASTSVIVSFLMERKVKLTPEEATFLATGIYNGTGSFSLSGTTELDFRAAAYLVSCGGDPRKISLLTRSPLDAQQQSLMDELSGSIIRHNINNLEIGMANAAISSLVKDTGDLVQKTARLNNLDILFAIIRMENEICIEARCLNSELSAISILKHFEGEGDEFSASANISDKTLAQTEQELLGSIIKETEEKKTASKLMSSPAITITKDTSCQDAASLLTRYNINALIVARESNRKKVPEGFISRHIIEKARYHTLDNVPVEEYMRSDIEFVTPDADLYEIQEKIIDNKQRILPVIQDEDIIGVISRTDLLNTLVQKSRKEIPEGDGVQAKKLHARTKKIADIMEERLPSQIMKILSEIGEIAHEKGLGVYVVGGFVRDLLIGKENDDVDIVIEGDGIAFARTYAEKTGAHINTYEKFGTAVIVLEDGFKVDIASARMEYYKSPAALPTVEMSSIKLDLFRRDFTINTMAVQLNPPNFGSLIDFFSAQKDLEDKAIRILHNLSFVEDPTRVFRAIRFEQRFGFKIGELTSNLIKNVVKMDFFTRLSGLRVFNELRQIMEEKNPIPAIIRLFDYKLPQLIHPEIVMDENLVRILNNVQKVLTWHDLIFKGNDYDRWSVYFMALLNNTNRKDSDRISKRLKLRPKHQYNLSKKRLKAETCLEWLDLNLPVDNSILYTRLHDFKAEHILYMMALTENEETVKAIAHYYTVLREIKISLMGRDLREIGIPEGPVYGKILKNVLNAKLNGIIKTREDEVEFVQKYKAKD